MKDHIPTFALVVSLAMVLAALVTLSLAGKGPDGPVVIGLVAAAGTVVGVIGGFSQNTKSGTPPSQTRETRAVETPEKDK